jgi:hypothetical protein
MTRLARCQAAYLTYLKTTLLALCAVASLYPTLSHALIFTNDFNRPDLPTVGNGWSDTAGNAGGNLEIKNNELTSTVTTGGNAGIFRPLAFTVPITASATLKEMNGFGGLLQRYDAGILVLNDGVRNHGYGVFFGRSDQNFANSTVTLPDLCRSGANLNYLPPRSTPCTPARSIVTRPLGKS